MWIFWLIVAIVVGAIVVWLVMRRRSESAGQPGVYGADTAGDTYTEPSPDYTGDVGASGLSDPVASDAGYASAEPSHETYDPASRRLSEAGGGGTSEVEAPASGQTGSVYVPADADPNDPDVGGHPPVPEDAEPWAPDLPEDADDRQEQPGSDTEPPERPA